MEKSKKNAYWISGICFVIWFILFMYGIINMSSQAPGETGIDKILILGSWVFFVAAMLIMITASNGWVIALGLGIFFVLLGLAIASSFIDKPVLPIGFLLPFSIVFLIAWMLWFSFGSMLFAKNKLLKTGEKVTGTLKSFAQTGGSIKISGQAPKYQTSMIFAVKLYDGQTIESTAKEMLSETEIYNLRAGNNYQLMIDKNKPTKAAVNWAENIDITKPLNVINSFGITNTTEIIENLLQKAPIIYHHKEEILQTGLKGMAIVLQSTPFAGMKSPDGRFVFLMVLEVQISGIPSYQTKGNYAIAQSKLPLTVPGSSLPVVVDPDNHSFVLVDWDKTS